MDKTQKSILSLYSPQDFRLVLNQTLLFQGVEREWCLQDWSPLDYDLLVCLKGEAFYDDGKEVHHMTRGKVFLAGPDLKVSACLGKEREFHVLAQHFYLTLAGGRDFLAMINRKPFGTINHMTLVDEYLSLINNRSRGNFINHDLFRTILWVFLEGSGSENEFLPRRDPLLEAVRELADFIRQDRPGEEELKQFQSRLPYSSVYLRDSFRDHFGRTPKQYLADQRMEQARVLLKEGYSVKETARLTGYGDELYFARVFKKYNRLSPGRFGRSVEM
jgi:AraC-like DNA-binding protein